MTWPQEELRQISEADDLHIAPFREDGATYGTPTWIWSVVTGGALYVRAYNGKNSRWYRAALKQRAGRIMAAGMIKDVTFEPVEGPVNDSIDSAYRKKYGGQPVSQRHDRRARPGGDSQGHASPRCLINYRE